MAHREERKIGNLIKFWLLFVVILIVIFQIKYTGNYLTGTIDEIQMRFTMRFKTLKYLQ